MELVASDADQSLLVRKNGIHRGLIPTAQNYTSGERVKMMCTILYVDTDEERCDDRRLPIRPDVTRPYLSK